MHSAHTQTHIGLSRPFSASVVLFRSRETISNVNRQGRRASNTNKKKIACEPSKNPLIRLCLVVGCCGEENRTRIKREKKVKPSDSRSRKKQFNPACVSRFRFFLFFRLCLLNANSNGSWHFRSDFGRQHFSNEIRAKKCVWVNAWIHAQSTQRCAHYNGEFDLQMKFAQPQVISGRKTRNNGRPTTTTTTTREEKNHICILLILDCVCTADETNSSASHSIQFTHIAYEHISVWMRCWTLTIKSHSHFGPWTEYFPQNIFGRSVFVKKKGQFFPTLSNWWIGIVRTVNVYMRFGIFI